MALPEAEVTSGEPDHPGARATLGALLAASRGFWLVNLVNFADGVAYFGVLALTTLFLEVNASPGSWPRR